MEFPQTEISENVMCMSKFSVYFFSKLPFENIWNVTTFWMQTLSVILQTEFDKYAAEVERLDYELCDVKNQLKCSREESCCLKKTLSDNEHEFEICLRRADEHSRDLSNKLQEVEIQLANFCTHTHEPAIANATNKVRKIRRLR